MITELQKQERKSRLGASEIGCIFGLSPFQSAYDIWAMKTGRADGFSGNAATDRGNFLEPGILDWAESELGAKLVREVPTKVSAGGVVAANLDAECPDLDAIIEAKSSSNRDEYGDEAYSDQIPDRTIIQVQIGMHCAKRSVSYIPALFAVFGRFEFKMYSMPYRPDLAEAIVERAEKWWLNHVLADVPPDGSLGSIEVLKRMRREPGKIIAVPDEIVSAWDALRQHRLQAEKQEEEAEQRLLTAIGDAECAEWSGGTVSYMETVQNVKAKEACVRRFRVLRMKRAKVGKEMVTA